MDEQVNETLECHWCKEEIKEGARVCPHCGKFQPRPGTTADAIGGFILGLIIVMIFFSLIMRIL